MFLCVCARFALVEGHWAEAEELAEEAIVGLQLMNDFELIELAWLQVKLGHPADRSSSGESAACATVASGRRRDRTRKPRLAASAWPNSDRRRLRHLRGYGRPSGSSPRAGARR